MLAKIEVELGRPICGDELARDHRLAVTRRTFVEERRGVIQPITPSSNGGQAESSQSIERVELSAPDVHRVSAWYQRVFRSSTPGLSRKNAVPGFTGCREASAAWMNAQVRRAAMRSKAHTSRAWTQGAGF